MENLFKLKRDNKTVGYLKIRGGNILGSVDGKRFTFVTEQNQRRGIYLYKDIGRPFIDYDTAYPFVTKDKNGKDVFVGDRVRRINGEPCFIEWYAEECRYVLHNNQNYYDIDVLELEQGIELIEEKEDEQSNGND